MNKKNLLIAAAVTVVLAAAIIAYKAKTKKAVEEPTIKIIKATYGVDGQEISILEKAKIGDKITNILAGSDPAPGFQKRAIITAILPTGQEVTKTFKEEELIAF